jgi:hypothetical protein
MKEKSELRAPMNVVRRPRTLRSSLGVIAICLGLVYVYTHLGTLPAFAPVRWQKEASPKDAQSTTTKLVPLEAHIMSKCPDARVGCFPRMLRFLQDRSLMGDAPSQDCLRNLILPVMQRVHEKVNFTLSFIGTYVKPGPSDPVGYFSGPLLISSASLDF